MVKLIVFRLHPYNTISFILFAPMLKIQLFLNVFAKKRKGDHENPAAYLISNGVIYK